MKLTGLQIEVIKMKPHNRASERHIIGVKLNVYDRMVKQSSPFEAPSDFIDRMLNNVDSLCKQVDDLKAELKIINNKAGGEIL